MTFITGNIMKILTAISIVMLIGTLAFVQNVEASPSMNGSTWNGISSIYDPSGNSFLKNNATTDLNMNGYIINNSGNIIINKTNAQLSITSPSGVATSMINASGSGGQSWYWQTGDISSTLNGRLRLVQNSNGNERVTILPTTGYVGINNSNPQANLHINDINAQIISEGISGVATIKINASGTGGKAWYWQTGDASSTLNGRMRLIQEGTSSEMITILPTTGYVGINNSNPLSPLNVNGDVNITGFVNTQKVWGVAGESLTLGANGDNLFALFASGGYTGKPTIDVNKLFYPLQSTSPPSYVRGAIYYDTTKNTTIQGTTSSWEAVNYNASYDALLTNAPNTTIPSLQSLVNSSNRLDQAINFVISNGTNVIGTGIKGDVEIPFSGTIIQATALADQSGSFNVSWWKDSYANYPPTAADILGYQVITTAIKNQTTGLSQAVTAGDILRFNVESATTVTRVTISLTVRRD